MPHGAAGDGPGDLAAVGRATDRGSGGRMGTRGPAVSRLIDGALRAPSGGAGQPALAQEGAGAGGDAAWVEIVSRT